MRAVDGPESAACAVPTHGAADLPGGPDPYPSSRTCSSRHEPKDQQTVLGEAPLLEDPLDGEAPFEALPPGQALFRHASHREAAAALPASALQYVAPLLRFHPRAESVSVLPPAPTRLVGPFHLRITCLDRLVASECKTD